MRGLAAFLTFGFILLAACGDDGSGPPADGSTDGGVGADGSLPPEWAVAPPEAPRIPWWNAGTGEVSLDVAPPTLTPCPTGWSEVVDEEAVYCEPWPAGEGECTGSEVRFPGDAACAPLGPACPSGRFPTDLPAGVPVVYIDGSAAPGGDGSLGAPYDDLSAAVLAEGTRSVVFAVAPGRYDATVSGPTVSLRSNNTFIGACVSGVVLTASTSVGTNPVVFANGTGIELRNVTIESNIRTGIFALGANIDIENVLIAQAREGGIGANRSSVVTGSNLVIRDVVATGSGFGGGIVLREGARGDFTRVLLEDLPSTGVLAFDGGSFAIHDAAIRGLRANTTEGLGAGLASIDGGFTAERVVVEENRVIGLRLGGAGRTATITDALLRTNLATGIDDQRQVQTQDGGRMELHRVTMRDCDVCGLASGAGSALVVDDLVAVDARGAVWVQFDATATVTRAHVDRMPRGFFATGPTTMALTDAFMRGGGDSTGFGFDARDGATLTVERAHCVDTVMICAAALGVGTTLTLTDFWSSGNRSLLPFTNASRAVSAESGGAMTVRRALIERAQDISIAVLGGGTGDVEDLVVRDSAADDTHEPFGWGIAATQGSGRFVRTRVERAQALGVVVAYGGTLDLEDVAVHDVQPEAGSGRRGIGVHVFATDPSTLIGNRVEVDGAHDTGVLVFGDADVELNELRVTNVDGIAGPELAGEYGRGLEFGSGSRLVLNGGLIDTTRDIGMAFFAAGTTADLTRVAILDTRARACVDTTCIGDPSGMGLGAYEGATVTVRDFLIRSANLCGVHLASSASLDLSDGVVEGNDIGACVQIDGYDLDRISSDVVYQENGSNLDATTLPVPQPNVPTEPMP